MTGLDQRSLRTRDSDWRQIVIGYQATNIGMYVQ